MEFRPPELVLSEMYLSTVYRIIFAFLLVASLTGWASAVDRPNVVLVMTDDQGYGDVSIHGNQILQTQHLDRFAREGTQLTRFYCSPVCAPTRAALMTGRYSYRTGVIHTSRGAARMASEEKTLGEIFQDAGYVTGIFGKWHLGDNYPLRPQDQGFQQNLVHKSGGITQAPDQPNDYFDPLLWKNGHPVQAQGYCTDVFFTAAINFIKDSRDVPFFAYIATNAPHTPLIVDEDAWRRYTENGQDEVTAKIYAMVENIDQNFGRLLATLEKLKLRENTIVIFLTDNGPQQKRFNGPFSGRKSMVLEGGIHVPCFVQWPAKLKGGEKVETRHAHIDLLPTLVEATGIQVDLPNPIDGISFWSQLLGSKKEVVSRNLFFQVHRGLKPEPYHNAAVLGERYKLVMNVGSFGKEKLTELAEKQRTGFQLFDLIEDPGEQNDLAEQLPEKVEQLTKAYDSWFADVKSSRGFSTPAIMLGSRATDSTLLCRYQDGQYQGNRHLGWKVEVQEPVLVQLLLNQEAKPGQKLMVQWLGNVVSFEVKDQKQPVAALQLTPGTGRLDVWLQEEGKPREYIKGNSTTGDVVVSPVRETR